jgi:diguanylate cyclase (GGDEF)-like protein
MNVVAFAMGDAAASFVPFREKLRYLRRHPGLLLSWPIAALILAAAGWGAVAAKLDHDRRAVEKAALRDVAVVSRGYANHLMRTIEAIDQILLHVKFDWELSGGRLRLETIKEERLFPPSSVFNVGIVDRDGRLVTSTLRGAEKNRITDEDRPFFLAHKNAANDFLYIGSPVYGRLSHMEVVPFSRRLTDLNGNFDGVVAVSVIPAYFTAAYDAMTLGDNGLLGFVGRDHVIRAMRTGQTVYGAQLPLLVAIPPLAEERGSALLVGDKWFTDQRSRYIGWQAVGGYPLIAVAGLDYHDTLSFYRANRIVLIRAASWATIALVAFILMAMAQSIRLSWRKYELEMTQSTYRMATEGGNEGFYIVRPLYEKNGEIVDFAVIDSNSRGAEFLRCRREDLIGRKLSALYPGGGFERAIHALRRAMQSGFNEDDAQVPSDSPLALRWVHYKIVRSNHDLAVTLRDISDTKAYVQELERRSNEDALTGLPNRYWLQSYLPRAIEGAAAGRVKLALLFMDLDRFKEVNDTFGHTAGDELLRKAARRLTVAVRPQDKVARLGGDEFVIILESIAHERDAAHVAERVVHAFEESFTLTQGVQSVGTSVGISVFPSDGRDADTLLRNADIAMYSVKASGKNNYRFFDPKYYQAVRDRLEQESELRRALEHDQFVMYYQARFDSATCAVSSLEALLRWSHPSRGLLAPSEFIAVAEESGLIIRLGEIVINKVCFQLSSWAQQGWKPLPVSINVSPRQFNEADIAKTLLAALVRHHVDPKLLQLELTESSMMGNNADVYNALIAIRRMGMNMLVDDFGTGYSSLSQLQQLDVEGLKVDQSFTAGIETEKGRVFYQAIVTMAHALKMRVVAEGVESENQAKILKSLGCNELQGFYLARPSPACDMQSILRP